MKKLLNNTAARAARFILVAMCGFLAWAIAIGILYSAGGYSSGAEKLPEHASEGYGAFWKAETRWRPSCVDPSTKDVTTDEVPLPTAIYDGNSDEVCNTLDGENASGSKVRPDSYVDGHIMITTITQEAMTSGLEVLRPKRQRTNGRIRSMTRNWRQRREADSGTTADEAPEQQLPPRRTTRIDLRRAGRYAHIPRGI